MISNIILGRVYLWICEWNAYAYREGWKKVHIKLTCYGKQVCFRLLFAPVNFVFFFQNKRPTWWRTSIRIELTNPFSQHCGHFTFGFFQISQYALTANYVHSILKTHTARFTTDPFVYKCSVCFISLFYNDSLNLLLL